MPYYHDCYHEPKKDADWDVFWEMWNDIKNDLMSTYFEEKEEAINQVNRPHKDLAGDRFGNWNFIPYRESNDHDQLKYYHELGLEELSYTEYYIEKEQMGARFTFHWGRLTACHGYVLAHAMVTGNDVSRFLSGEGSRKKLSRDLQRKWFSHYYFRKELSGLSREQRTEKVGSLVNWILEFDPESCRNWGAAWFERLLNLQEDTEETNEHYGLISGAYRQKKLSEKAMKALLDEPIEDIPPIDLPFPTP